MLHETWGELHSRARQALLIEQMATSIIQQIKQLKKEGIDERGLARLRSAHEPLNAHAKSLKRLLARAFQDVPVIAWAKQVHGLGDAVALFVGVIRPLCAEEGSGFPGFATVSKVWKFCGLAPGQRKKKGERTMFSPRLKSYATMRLAEPTIKQAASPYRPIYVDRKGHTMITHPPMVDEGCEGCDRARGHFIRKKKRVDCSFYGGPHWSPAHRHKDAIRIVAKAILKDIWLVDHGLPAVVGIPAGETVTEEVVWSTDTVVVDGESTLVVDVPFVETV